MLVRPMLLHRMALVSVRLFCKNLGNLQEFFGQMVYRPPGKKLPVRLCTSFPAIFYQRAKKVVSDSPGLVDFAIGPVNPVFNLPNGQVRFFQEFE